MSIKKTVSIIVSVYNEQEVLYEFWKELYAVIKKIKNYNFNVIFVNDGSKDNSQEIIDSFISEELLPNVFVKTIEFSKNFGHEAAMIAGIDESNDDLLICLDADLQHPPKNIHKIIKKYEEGHEIVLMKRITRADNSFIKNYLSKLFYKTILWLSETSFEQNASDFFMISKNVAQVLKNNFRERNRFLRGFIQIIGFNLTTIEYNAPARFSGESNYSFIELAKLGFTAIFAFSNKPLRLSLLFSSLFFLFSLILSIYTLFTYFFGNKPPDGYTTLIIFQSIGFAVICFLISVISIYFGKSLEEIRDRPIYLIKSTKTSNK
ncbi:MAG: glycosyltransferase family 2 protein [Cytophagales bacterium]|nr:glycosyltransferase family 2 protein [Cytophagales bacterium]